MKDSLITSSLLICVVLVLRALLGHKISRRLQYGLWLVVLVRLLLPVNLPALQFSVLSAAQPVQERVESQLEDRALYLQPIGREPSANYPQSAQAEPGQLVPGAVPASGYPVLSEDGETVTRYAGRLSAGKLLTMVWKAGMAVVGLWFLISNLFFWRKLCKARLPYSISGIKRQVWMCGQLTSPCLFGLFQPSIYLNPAAAASEQSLRHVLVHEETHARHLDYIWSLLRCMCLTIYWFNPLVWAAAYCSRCDCELACDESAVKTLGEASRLDYGRTLLSLVPVKSSAGSLLRTATTMHGSKRQLADRLRRIASNQKTMAGAFCVVAVALVAATLLTFTGAREETSSPETGTIADAILEGEPDAVLSLDGAKRVGPQTIATEPAAFSLAPQALGEAPRPIQASDPAPLAFATLHPDSWEDSLTVLFYQEADGGVSAACLWSSPLNSDLRPRRFRTLSDYVLSQGASALSIEVLEDGFLGYDDCVALRYPDPLGGNVYVSEFYAVSRYSVTFLGQDYGETYIQDLDGDGIQEVYCQEPLSQGSLRFRREDGIYSADLTAMLHGAYPDWNYVELYWNDTLPIAQGYAPFPDSPEGGGALAQRYLRYDGNSILCYRDNRATVDHVREGIDAPEEVLAAARELVRRVYPGNRSQAESTAWEPAWDDWRLTYLDPVWSYDDYGIQAEVYQVGYEFHAVAPSQVGLAGGMYVDEDGWVGALNLLPTPYLVFQVQNGRRVLLDSAVAGDCSPGSLLFLAGLSRTLVDGGLLPFSALSPHDLLSVFYDNSFTFLSDIAGLSVAEQTELGKTLSWFRYNGTDAEIERFSHAVLVLRNTGRASFSEEQLLAYENLLEGLRANYGSPGNIRQAEDPATGLAIAIPSSWTDLCCLYTGQEEFVDRVVFRLYEGTARSTGNGHVWTLLAYTKGDFYSTFGQSADLSQIQGTATYVLGTDDTNIYCLALPTDVQFLENNATSRRQYETLVSGSRAVLTDFLSRNEITVNERCPDSECWSVSSSGGQIPARSAPGTAQAGDFGPEDVEFQNQALSSSPDDMGLNQRMNWLRDTDGWDPNGDGIQLIPVQYIESGGCVAYQGYWAGTPHMEQNELYLRFADDTLAVLPLPRSSYFGTAAPDTMEFSGNTLVYKVTFPDQLLMEESQTLIHLEGTYRYAVDLTAKTVSLEIVPA